MKPPARMLQQAVDASAEVIFMTDLHGTLTFVNQAFEHVYGYTASDVVGKHSALLLKSDRTTLAEYCAIWERLKHGDVVRSSFSNKTRDGRLIDVEATLNAVHDDAGAFAGYMAIERDVTVDNMSSAALAKSEARYRALAEGAHDAIFIVGGDNRYEYANRTAAAGVGLTPAAVIGRTIADCFSPEVARRIEDEINGVRTGGVATYSEQPIAFAHGTHWMSTWLVPVPDAQGKPCDVMGIARDMTDRHQMAELLDRQRLLLEAVIQASPVGIVLVTANGWICEMANAAVRAFGGEALVTGASVADAWPGAAAALVPLLERAAASATPLSQDLHLPPARAGEVARHAVVTASRLELPHHPGAAVLLMLTDVTDRKQLEDQLLQAQKMEAIGRLAGGIAHDFNNLLTPIIGYSELVTSTLADDDPRRRDLDEISRAAHSASALTRRLLTFSRKQVTEPTVLDLNDVLTDVERIVRRAIGEDVEVTVSCAPGLGRIRADRTQLEQIVMNLGVNARDAMPVGGRLLITTTKKTLHHGEAGARRPIPAGEYIVLSVTDTGTGMTPEVQSHLFEPFFTTKEFGKGTGLGLSTVYGIVKQSDGHISVRSAPGQGTTFLVYFPCTDAPATPTAEAAAPIAPPAVGHETVLIVEDNDGLRRLAQRILTDAGYTTLAAEDSDAAMRVAHEFHAPIHLLLTDVVMPKTDGLTLAHEMAAERPDTRVLLMSGYSGDDVKRRGVLPTGIKLLQKPFTRASLTRMVRQTLDGKTPLPASPTEAAREHATMR
jgi:two-component system, cell cycle sensor histidine kinase and response regulator CckA